MIATAQALAGVAVVPTREVAAGETLRQQDVEWVDWPAPLAHPDLFSDPDDVIGRVARVPLLPGEPLRAQRLYPRGHEGLTQGRQLVTVPLASPTSAWGPGTHLDLLALDDGPPCVVGQRGRVLEGLRGDALIRDGGVPAEALRIALPIHDAARVAHAVREGRVLIPVARSDDDEALASLAECASLSADRIDVPPSGWSVGVRPPATAVRLDHPERLDVREMGDPGWFHLVPTGAGPVELVLERGDEPPLLLDVVPRPAPGDDSRLHVPRGGAVLLPLSGEVVYHHVVPEGLVDVERDGRHLVVIGREEGAVTVTARAEDDTPSVWAFSVGASWPMSREPELVIPAGRTRTLRPDRATARVLVADPEVVELVRHAPGRPAIRVRGATAGRTTLVLFAEDGSATTVRVVVVP